MNIKSYAKINLTLDILKKREDGYHEIATVFQQVGLCDEIELTKISEGIEIECNVKNIAHEGNLAYKAARLVKEKYPITEGVKIDLEKTIPIGAGLSGGSSNAAAVLKGMNELFSLNLSSNELIELSKELGMDVAFHILGGTCVGRGRGEILEKVADFPAHYVVIVYPGFSINTAKAYGGIDIDTVGKKKSTGKFIENYSLDYLHNDFEQSIFKEYPKLEELKKQLGDHSLLSGSGSCVFGLFEKEEDAQKVYEEIKKTYPQTFLARTINGI